MQRLDSLKLARSVSNGHRSAQHEGKPGAPFAGSVAVDLCRCRSRQRGSGASLRARTKPSRPAASSPAAARAHADSHGEVLADARFSGLSGREGG